MKERILHVALKGVDGENQEALGYNLAGMGEYLELDWRKVNLPANRGLFLDAVAQFKPTVVFMQLQTPNVILPEQLLAARKINKNCLYFQWNGDLREQANHNSMLWQTALGAVCDSTLLTNLDDVDWLNKLGIGADYLQIGYDWSIYKPKTNVAQADDVPSVVFMGSYYPQLGYESGLRMDLATELYEALDGDFACYGHQWTGYPWGMPRVNDVTEAHIYQQCKIAIVLSLRSDVACYTSDRLFRATGCGTFCMVKRFKGMERLYYIDQQSCIAWDTVPELVTRVKDWLGEGKERWRRIIADNGADVAKLHTWSCRMGDLRTIIDRRRNVHVA